MQETPGRRFETCTFINARNTKFLGLKLAVLGRYKHPPRVDEAGSNPATFNHDNAINTNLGWEPAITFDSVTAVPERPRLQLEWATCGLKSSTLQEEIP